jgi:hypothetical protein
MKNKIIALLLTAIALPAAAQNSLTLYGGYAWGGTLEQQTGNTTSNANLSSGFAGAASIDWALDAARNVQLFASGQRTTLQLAGSNPSSVDMGLYYLHFGGSNFFEGRAGQGGYVAGGIGATWMSPSGSGFSSEVRPSASLAIGYEHAINPSLALRAELRGYATLINSSGGFFCSGGCVVSLQGDALFQAAALVGLSLRF